MSKQIPTFFLSDEYFIDEKVNFLKFANEYKVYNDQGAQIGIIKQRISGWHKALTLLINKAMMPFKLEITDANNQLQATISRGWTFWMSKITVTDPMGVEVGIIKQKFKFFKPTFTISDPATGANIAQISGDWKAWNFTITNNTGAEMGKISKKWGGALKEVFTTADKYNVSIDPNYAENNQKVAIVATAITIDMVLKEGK
ncbi:LURP-one-related/scramblase family protein [Pedobacter punctiformis]|uniref:Phospholipid scramblase-related protein n=1 Tax=Pedobacter punctiformis TaxID=3004097 RepID=A0ABT4LAW2_9SPHI|nr:phospholipid scramblase-related protein [Pedobacter sp. HCMS5-2]MCZ4245064.1 phospholipid scramblase-related protein [Pedobacter sp. HCMS5-2]